MPAIRIAAPCAASWDSMPGDDRIRHCLQCDLDVYNFSEMAAPEIAQLVKAHTGRLCARFYQRADGTMLTKNCPVGAPPQVPSASLLATAALAALVGIAPVRASAAPQNRPAGPAQAHQTEEVFSLIVRDAAGGVIAGAGVSLTNARTGERFDAKTNAVGELSLSTLSSGTYDLSVTQFGFTTFVQNEITVPAQLVITLQIGALMGEVVEIPGTLAVTLAEAPTTLSEPASLVQSPPFQPADRPNSLRRLFSKLRRALR